MNDIRRGDVVALCYHTSSPAAYPAIVTSATKKTGFYVVGKGFGRIIRPSDNELVSLVKIGTAGNLSRHRLLDVARSFPGGPLSDIQMAAPLREARRFAYLNRHEITMVRRDYEGCKVLFAPRIDGTILLRFSLSPNEYVKYAFDDIADYVAVNLSQYEIVQSKETGHRRHFYSFILRRRTDPPNDKLSRFVTELRELSHNFQQSQKEAGWVSAPAEVHLLIANTWRSERGKIAKRYGFASFEEGLRALRSRVSEKWAYQNLPW